MSQEGGGRNSFSPCFVVSGLQHMTFQTTAKTPPPSSIIIPYCYCRHNEGPFNFHLGTLGEAHLSLPALNNDQLPWSVRWASAQRMRRFRQQKSCHGWALGVGQGGLGL